MSYSIKQNAITLTRGDTFKAQVEIRHPDGSLYTPKEGDQIRFAAKKKISDTSPLILIEIPISTMQLVITPADTKPLDFGEYWYDIQITKANGDVDTFITKSVLKLTEEVE